MQSRDSISQLVPGPKWAGARQPNGTPGGLPRYGAVAAQKVDNVSAHSEMPLAVTIPTTETKPRDVSSLVGEGGPFETNPAILLLGCLLLIAVLAVCAVAADIILPLILAFVLKLLLQPAMRLLERIRVPRILAALVLIIVLFAAIVAVVMAVAGPASSWAGRLPEGLPRLEERLAFLSHPIKALQGFLAQIDGGKDNAGGLGLTAVLFKGTQHFAAGFFETILILFFLLLSGDTFLRRMVEIVPRFSDKRQIVELSQQIEENISAYLVTITLMNLLVGIATGVVMWLAGLGDPVLWGVAALVLNFVPIMGPALGVLLFLFAGLLSIDTFWGALAPAGFYLMIHLIEGELVTPMLLARRFTLNPVLVILSLIFWFWMWGAPGAILAVPLLAMFKIVCEGVKPLNSVAHFLGG